LPITAVERLFPSLAVSQRDITVASNSCYAVSLKTLITNRLLVPDSH